MPGHDSTPDPFVLCGTTIEGKYRVSSVVGDGGFGVVYRGVHAGFGEPIAIKCLKLPHVLDDKQRDGFLEQLREEGRLLHRLSKATPGIVQALDVGAVTTPAGGWVPYLVLEWLEGDTLADHLAKRLTSGAGPFSLVDAIRLLEPAARALGVAHAMKVAHRDVKPHNLFVTKVASASTVKVLDFGIAKVLTDYPTFREALAATKATPAAFTPRYGAPEQFNKARGPSGPWTDVFALGLILVELLTGDKALEGDDPTQLYVAAADPARRPTPRARGAAVPEAVEEVVKKALAVEPRERYADAGELIDALLTAAGLAPALPSGVLGTSSSGGARTVVEGGARNEVEPPTVAEARGLAAIEPTEVAPGNTRNAARTSRSPGAGPRPAVLDPMSETPFFERHHLPPSQALVGAAGTTGSSEPRDPPPAPRRSWMRLVVLVALAGGGAAVYAAIGDHGERRAPPPGPSGITFKTPVLPLAPSAAPGAPSASVVPASMSASPPAPGTTASTTDMVLIAAASFKMGEEVAARAVIVAHDFYLDRMEVTVRAYQACVAKRMCAAASHVSLPAGAGERWGPVASGEGGADAATAEVDDYRATWSRHCNAPRGAEDHPVNCVDFAGAEAYCRWVGKRLPTEGEWELAARGAEGRAYPWGSEAPACGRACYDKNGGCREPGASVGTCAAGMYPADRTPDGIYDLAGNVAEWTAEAAGDAGAATRVARGGSFIDSVEVLRATTRSAVPPALAHVGIGFRCALDAPAKATP
jgi:serine/threonine-protein kinase